MTDTVSQTDELRPVCARCGLWCLILHKTHRTIDDDTTLWYHDAHGGDCWEQEIAARMGRAEARS